VNNMTEYKLKIHGKEQFVIKEIGDMKLDSDDLLSLENAIESKIEYQAQIAYENMMNAKMEQMEEQNRAMQEEQDNEEGLQYNDQALSTSQKWKA